MRTLFLLLMATATPALAIDKVDVARTDDKTVRVAWTDSDPVDI